MAKITKASRDVVIPLVFPDYVIATGLPRSVRVPDLIPKIDILPERLRVPDELRRISDAGHAGVLLIEAATGLTKYYEYGRYDPAQKGIVRIRSVPDVAVRDGQIDRKGLARVLSRISGLAGQHGRISGVYIEVPGKFLVMNQNARRRLGQNRSPERDSYGLLSHSCLHFMKSIVEAGGVELPMVIDPRPIAYMQKLRSVFPPFDYDSRSKALTP